jgi:hypothetical protein
MGGICCDAISSAILGPVFGYGYVSFEYKRNRLEGNIPWRFRMLFALPVLPGH